MWAVVTWSHLVLVSGSCVFVGRSVVVVLECECDIFFRAHYETNLKASHDNHDSTLLFFVQGLSRA